MLLISLSLSSNNFCQLLFQHVVIDHFNNIAETLNTFYRLVSYKVYIEVVNNEYNFCFVHFTTTTKIDILRTTCNLFIYL